MKLLITILFILFASCAYAQVKRYDTIPHLIPVIIATQYYLIMDTKGKVVDRVTKVETWSVPQGGSATKERLISREKFYLVGNVVFRTDSIPTENGIRLSMAAIAYLTADKKPIPKTYIIDEVSGYIPIAGYNFP